MCFNHTPVASRQYTFSQGTDYKGGFERLCIEELWHLPCSPELASCDLHPFSSLKGRLSGKHFVDENGLMTAKEQWLQRQDKTVYLIGIEKLSKH